MYDWDEFERLITEAKTYLPQKMNSTQRGVAMGFFLRGIEQTGGDVQAYRDAMFVLRGGEGRFNFARGRRAPVSYPKGNMWLRGKDTKTWVPAKAP